MDDGDLPLSEPFGGLKSCDFVSGWLGAAAALQLLSPVAYKSTDRRDWQLYLTSRITETVQTALICPPCWSEGWIVSAAQGLEKFKT